MNLDTLKKIDPASAKPGAKEAWLWYDAPALGLEGRGWQETEKPYHRLPPHAQAMVTGGLWGLSKHSAGLCVRFATDANAIKARWTVTSKNLAMPHMPATGVSGVDLYARGEPGWVWIGAGRPGAGQRCEAQLAGDLPEGAHEYLLYLPLYNGTKSLEIGLPADATLAKAPPRKGKRTRPICFYGTSIVQGGCASRPGMAHPAILGRRLDWPVVNLGFSGSARMEPELAQLLAELDPAAYVLDPLPNMTTEMVAERAEPFVRALRQARPKTPILLVEGAVPRGGAFIPVQKQRGEEKNEALRAAFSRLKADRVPGLHYVSAAGLELADNDGTVDGVHPTDLGFHRFADALEPALLKALRVR